MSIEVTLVATRRDSSFPQIIAHLASCTEAALALEDWVRPRGIRLSATDTAHALFDKAFAMSRARLDTVELKGEGWEWCEILDSHIWMIVSY